MADRKEGGRTFGADDFSPELRDLVCSCFVGVLDEKERANVLSGCELHFKQGRLGDPRVTRAWRAFETVVKIKHSLKDEAGRVDRPNYRRILHEQLHNYISSPHGTSGHRKRRRITLTQAEWDEAACILGTPRRHRRKQWHYFRSLQECLAQAAHEESDRLAALFDKSKLPPLEFETELLRNCSFLHYTKTDTQEELAKDTLKDRQRAARIWRGEDPWITSAQRNGPNLADLKWNSVYYTYCTFMLDAFTVETSKQVAKAIKSFRCTNLVYPPEALPRMAPATKCVKVMFYIVIHPEWGLVAGPAAMYHGSNSKTGTKTGPDVQKHDDSKFSHWCVCVGVVSLLLSPTLI